MYAREDRIKAVLLFIKYNQNESKVISEHGYPSPNTLRSWHREYEKSGDLHEKVKYKERYSKQQMEVDVTYYTEHDVTIAQACRTLGYPCRPLLRRWIKELHPEALNQHKHACKRKDKRVYYSYEQKEAAVRMNTEDHIPIYRIAAEYGVSKAAVSKWKRDILCRNGSITMNETKGDVSVSHRKTSTKKDEMTNRHEALLSELASLQEEVYKLRMERDALEKATELLKKAEGIKLTEISNLEKAGVIDALRTQYRLKDLLELFKMSKSSYCYSHNVAQKADKYHTLRDEIRRVFSDSNNTYGYRRVKTVLSREGLTISEKIIRRLMKEDKMVVFQVRRRKYNSYRGEISPEVSNIINRDFHANKPNEKWLTDITEFSLPSGKVYLSPIIDCFDGYVVSWIHGTSPSAELANRMLDQAIQSLGENERPIIHSDRGCHYRWPDWIRKTEEAGLTRSMSRKGCSPDNSACEGFFGRLKIEMFYGRSWQGVTTEQFSAILDEYIIWYNSKRVKLSLGGFSPAQYRRNLGY